MLKKASGVLAMVIAMSASGFAAAADKVTYQLDWLPGGDTGLRRYSARLLC